MLNRQSVEQVPITKAKATLTSLVRQISTQGKRIGIGLHGQVQAVVIPVAKYEEYEANAQRLKRLEALELLRQMRERAINQPSDIKTEEEAEELAVQLSRELIHSIAEREPNRFERLRK